MTDSKFCDHKNWKLSGRLYWCPDCGALLGYDPPPIGSMGDEMKSVDWEVLKEFEAKHRGVRIELLRDKQFGVYNIRECVGAVSTWVELPKEWAEAILNAIPPTF